MTKLILNNCIDCGRSPELIPVAQGKHFHPKCKCGKELFSDFKTWSREVAADMWNRANPVRPAIINESDLINYLASMAAKRGLKPVLKEFGCVEFIGNMSIKDGEDASIALDLIRYRTELYEFYKSRLEPA